MRFFFELKPVMSLCRCAICQVEFEEGETVLLLPCKHLYHNPCIRPWLADNKVSRSDCDVLLFSFSFHALVYNLDFISHFIVLVVFSLLELSGLQAGAARLRCA